MATLRYMDEHNKVGYLLKPTGSDDYHQIIDFLRASHIRYALTHEPIIFDSLVKQFWSTATLRSPELGPPAIQATIDKTPYIITEDLVRSQLQLADDGGIDDLPIAEIYSGMDNLGPLVVTLICLSDGRQFNWSSYIFKGMGHLMPLLAAMLSQDQEDEPLGGSFHMSPPRSTQAPPTGQASGGAEDLITLTALSSVVSTLMYKVNSLETELKDHKKLFKDVVGKLVKKVKLMKVKLMTSQRKLVISDSDQEEGGKQDVGLDALLALANATVTVDSNISSGGASDNLAASTSVPAAVPTGALNVPTGSISVPAAVPTCASNIPTGSTSVPADVSTGVAPPGVSNKGKALMMEEDIPIKERSFKQMQEDILGEKATKRLHDEEQAHADRQRAELQRRKQQEVLASAMYYTEADWINIMAQVEANASLSKTLLGDDVFEDNFPARMAALIKMKKQSCAVYSTGCSMARVKSFTDDQLKEEFEKIQKAISNIQIQAFSRTLKRTVLVIKEPSSKRQKFTEAPIPSVPKAPPSPVVSSPKSSDTRRKSLDKAPRLWSALVGWEVITTPLGDINSLYRIDRSTVYFTTLREILHMVDRYDLVKLYGLVVKYYETHPVAGTGLILWGDLQVLFDSHRDVSYPLSVKLMERMLMHKLEIDKDVMGNDMTTTEQLIQFIKNQLAVAQVSFFNVVDFWCSSSSMQMLFSLETFPDICRLFKVVVPTGRYVVPAGNVIVVSTSRLSVIPTGKVLSPVSFRRVVHRNYDPKGARFLIASRFLTPPLACEFFIPGVTEKSQSRNNFPQQEASPVIVEPLRIELPFLEDQSQEDPPPEVSMADNRTIAELLQAPTEGYEDAIVIPEIAANNFELKHEASVETSARRVILFCTIPTTIPNTTPTVTLPTTHVDTTWTSTEIPTVSPIVSPSLDYILASPDYSPVSDTKSDPSEDPSLDRIPPLPAILLFLSSTGDSSDSDALGIPPSPTHGQPYRYHPNGPLHMMTARKRVGPLPTHRFVVRHSTDYSSSDLLTSDDSSKTSLDSSLDDLSDSSSGYSSLDYPSPALPSGIRSSHQLCSSILSIPHSSTAIIKRPYHSSSAVSPTYADLLPPPKRIRSSAFAMNLEEERAIEGTYETLGALDCPKLRNQNRRNKTRNKTGNNEATTRAYAIEGRGANPDSNVVTGTFLLNNFYASMLFDSGSDRSFVSFTFSALLDVAPSTLDTSYAIELSDGKISETNIILRGCTLGLLGHPFDVDLMTIELGSFDVIIGMDWLAKYHEVIVCDEKVDRIPYRDEVMIIRGEDYDNEITSKKVEDKSEEKRLEDVSIGQEFMEVFLKDLPGLPPAQQFEFQIDLVPGVALVARAPYRLVEDPLEVPMVDNRTMAQLLQAPTVGPTSSDDPIVSTTSPTLTPFGDSDFLLFEEANVFLGLEDDPDSSELDPFYYDPEGDIQMLEAILNSDPAPSLPNHEQYVPSFTNELTACEAKTIKSSIDEPPEVELKDLPSHIEYAFLEGDNKLPVIIAKELGEAEKVALIKV
nr:putative reverse transcriptase domain-containing protein [Tanacetum cinerariifolium]